MTKKSLTAIIIGAFVFVALIVVATFFDLEISLAIGNADSFFGQFFNVFGMAFILLLLPTAGIILYQAISVDTKYYWAIKVLFILVILGGYYYLVDSNMGRLGADIYLDEVYSAVFAIVLTVLSILATNHIDKKVMKKLVIFAIFILIAGAISELTIKFMKHLWSRQRFRNMPEGDYSGFTQWYHPNWFGQGHSDAVVSDFAGASDSGTYYSFPSGHAGSAALSFMIVMLPEIFDKLKKFKIWFWVFPIIFTACTMLSRIIARAHFLSDVTFGVAVTLVVIFVTKKLVYIVDAKIKAKKDKLSVIINEEISLENKPLASLGIINQDIKENDVIDEDKDN
ncbi:MAG: phosphatase PAP2 family protein [Clostridia bacterium]